MGSEGLEDGSHGLVMLGEIAAEIAHELRNVLQIISSSAYAARQELNRGEAEAALSHVQKIERHARTAHAIVDDLLELARGEALRAEPVPLAGVIAAARAELPPGSADWHDALDPHDLRAKAHAGLLVRVLRVLYENAIQVSAPRRPRIATSARGDAGWVVVDVCDDGPGVAADIGPRVFDPLVTSRRGGTGLGLALARRIAIAHGGSLALLDGGDSGATFRLRLPAPG
jgi:signal transduction histidine kinase